jgi:phage terminase large subunit
MDYDRRLYLYREIYMSHRIVGGDPQGNDHATRINALSEGEDIIATICDHDAEDRATLEAQGIPTTAAMKAVSLGIQAVQGRLRRQADGQPRLFIMQDALVEVDPLLLQNKLPVCTEQEWEGYIWLPQKDGTPNKEQPRGIDDHGMDTVRYAVAYVDGIRPMQDDQVIVYTAVDDYEI